MEIDSKIATGAGVVMCGGKKRKILGSITSNLIACIFENTKELPGWNLVGV